MRYIQSVYILLIGKLLNRKLPKIDVFTTFQVRDKDNQDELRNLIQSACRALPSSLEKRCDLLVGKCTYHDFDKLAVS